MKTKYSMKSFPPAGWTWGDCVLHRSSVMPLFPSYFPFLFPPLHTGSETIELDNVCQVVNILKITGWCLCEYDKAFLCAPVQCALFKAGLFQRLVADAGQAFDSGLSSLWATHWPEKVWKWSQLIKLISETKEKGSCMSSAHLHGVFMTRGSDTEQRVKTNMKWVFN